MTNILLALLISISAHANPQLGKALTFENDPSDSTRIQFGAHYTYGGDIDGSRYMLLFNALLPYSEKPQRLVWNIYFAGENRFLLPWDNARSADLPVVSMAVEDAAVVRTIVLNQKAGNPAKQVFFVLAKQGTFEPAYHFSISEMCRSYPTYFSDLTNSKRCDRITDADF